MARVPGPTPPRSFLPLHHLAFGPQEEADPVLALARGLVCCRSRGEAAAGPAPGGEREEGEGGPVQPAGGGEEVRAAPALVLGGHFL